LLSYDIRCDSTDSCNSFLIASDAGSITPSRRKAASASYFLAIRSAVALSVVLAQSDSRWPHWSCHCIYQDPLARAPPRLNTDAKVHLPLFAGSVLSTTNRRKVLAEYVDCILALNLGVRSDANHRFSKRPELQYNLQCVLLLIFKSRRFRDLQ
jgi:hypothetical protein